MRARGLYLPPRRSLAFDDRRERVYGKFWQLGTSARPEPHQRIGSLYKVVRVGFSSQSVFSVLVCEDEQPQVVFWSGDVSAQPAFH